MKHEKFKLTNNLFDLPRGMRRIVHSPAYVSNGNWVVRLDCVSSWHSDPEKLTRLKRKDHLDNCHSVEDSYIERVFPKPIIKIRLASEELEPPTGQDGTPWSYYVYHDDKGYSYGFQARYINAFHVPNTLVGKRVKGSLNRVNKRAMGVFMDPDKRFVVASFRL